MIMHKIKVSPNAHEFSNMSYDEIQNKVFKKGSDNKNAFLKIVDYSFGRPRDVITYLGCIRDQFPNNTEIDHVAISASEADYSKKIIAEIKNEMSFTLDPITIGEIEELLRNFGERKFKYSELNNYYQEHINQYSHITDLENTLQYLYSLGLICNWLGTKNNKNN